VDEWDAGPQSGGSCGTGPTTEARPRHSSYKRPFSLTAVLKMLVCNSFLVIYWRQQENALSSRTCQRNVPVVAMK